MTQRRPTRSRVPGADMEGATQIPGGNEAMDVTQFRRQATLAVAAVAVSLTIHAAALAQSASEGRGFSVDQQPEIVRTGFFKRHRACEPCYSTPSCETTDCSTAPTDSDMTSTDPAPSEFDPNLFASSQAAPSSPQSLAPNMLGDSPGLSSFGSQRIHSRFLIADGTSPMPRGRAYFAYQYYQDAFNTTTDVHRGASSLEIPFANDRFSVQISNSLNTFTGGGAPQRTEGGNLNTVFKGLLVRDRGGLNISGGMGVGWPVGPTPDGFPGGNAILAPFIGYLYAPAGSNLFIQGFQQVDFPTANEDQALMHTDTAVGVWLRRNDTSRFITGIAPTIELHLYTPLGDAPTGSLTGLAYDDVLNATFGTTFVLGNRATLACGLGVPISTRKDYDVEAQVQFNWFFGAR